MYVYSDIYQEQTVTGGQWPWVYVARRQRVKETWEERKLELVIDQERILPRFQWTDWARRRRMNVSIDRLKASVQISIINPGEGSFTNPFTGKRIPVSVVDAVGPSVPSEAIPDEVNY